MEKESLLDQEKYIDVVNEVNTMYPQMYISSPLEYIEPDKYIPGMNSYEKRFANLLQTRGLFVFREPIIDGLSHIPDFFVYNPRCIQGKLVELTLYDSQFKRVSADEKSIKRKKRQIEEFRNCGIPFVAIYRENLEAIRSHCDMYLF